MNQKNSSLQGKRILIFQQRNWGVNIGHFLAKKLQAEGCKLAALTFKNSAHQFLLNQKEVKYELIINNDKIMGQPKEYLKGETYSLKDICRELGVDSIWPHVSALRNHVRSYKDKYYYSFKQNVADHEIIDYIQAFYKCTKKIFDEFDPDIIISPNFVSFPHILFNLYATQKEKTMLAVIDSKVKGYYIFTHNFKNNKGSFYDRVDGLNQGKVKSVNASKAKQYISEFREEFKKPDFAVNPDVKKSIYRKVRHELAPYYQSLRFIIRKPINVLPSTGITADYRPPRILLRDHYCHKKYKRFMKKFNYCPLGKIKKFVYFPLQFQPEETIDVAAPYFSNQIETARQIAMSLPDDYTLVIKEHPAMIGLRPPSYIEKIARTVNVKLIDYCIPSETVLKKCDLLVSPNSTTLSEAAYYNLPAIQLGDLGTTLKLPNIYRHTDMTTISSKIREILIVNHNTQEYERKLENFVAAVYDTGFNANYIIAWEKGDKQEMEKLWEIYKSEIQKNI
ncbi:MAG: hypothetical protein ABIJ91_00965 [Candidatus Kuenenbacteria bacterium]